MSHAADFADNFAKPWRLKRLLPAPMRLLGAAGAALLKALIYNQADLTWCRFDDFLLNKIGFGG
jgi:hypothetical protein